jgi:hypothetical protein
MREKIEGGLDRTIGGLFASLVEAIQRHRPERAAKIPKRVVIPNGR